MSEAEAPAVVEVKEDRFTFGEALWDCFEKVYKRVSKGRHDLKAMKAYLETRAKIEDTYSKELKKASTLPEFSEKSSLSPCWNSMKDSGVGLAKQHAEFAVMCNQIATILGKSVDEIKANKGKIHANYTKAEKEEQNKRAAHQKARTTYEDSVKAAEQAITNRDAGKFNASTNDKQMAKLETQVKLKLKDVEAANAAYQKSVQQLREAQSAFDQCVALSLAGLEDIERKRLLLLKEQYERYAQSHDFIKGSLEQVALILQKAIGEVHIGNDIQDFIKTNTTGKRPSPHVDYVPIVSDVINKAVSGQPTHLKTPTSSATPSTPLSTVTAPPSAPSPSPSAPTPTAPAASVPAPPPMMAGVPAAPSMAAPLAPPMEEAKQPVSGVLATALYQFDSEEPDDLTFAAGQTITLLHCPPEEDWWQGELDGRVGIFPKAYVEIIAEVGANAATPAPPGPPAPPVFAVPAPPAPVFDEPVPAPPAPVADVAVPEDAVSDEGMNTDGSAAEQPKLMDARCIALFDFDGQDADELSFKTGDALVITGELNGWYLGRLADGDKAGIFPSNYVELH